MNKILVTGAAGFIGFYLSKRLMEIGYKVVGIDSINDYYDISLKLRRLEQLGISGNNLSANTYDQFRFYKIDIANKESLNDLFEREEFDYIVHLAAQAGVRYSLKNPEAYVDSNVIGFINILESCRRYPCKHLLFASSSSVYGLNKQVPFSTSHNTDHPVSLYAATKKANEVIAHSYSHLFRIPMTGLRFFTVYGPWGRPDMAYFIFTRKIISGEPLEIYNNGNLMRDFTYIEDIIGGIEALINKPPEEHSSLFQELNPDPSVSSAPYRLFNIGNHTPVKLMDFIGILEDLIGQKAVKQFRPMQPGDVFATFADTSKLSALTGFRPSTSVQHGLKLFVDWYRDYYNV